MSHRPWGGSPGSVNCSLSLRGAGSFVMHSDREVVGVVIEREHMMGGDGMECMAVECLL